ncbi:MAG TPA: glycosyltransferase family 39 protein, partial [Chloroflexota bacterium]
MDGARRATTLRSLCLIPILALAAVLRFAALPSRGLLYWDEAKFLLEGVRLNTALLAVSDSRVVIPTGKAIGTAKPTHALLLALADALFGIHDYSGLFASAAFSVAGVALTFAVASLLFDPIVGLFAALILAVSEYDVIYARSALSESDANAILLTGVLLWLWDRQGRRSARRRYLLQGGAATLLGLAFTVNYRIAVYAAVIIGLDLLYGLRERGHAASMRRALIWLAGFLAAPAAWEILDLVARARHLVLFRSEITLRPTSYLQEVMYQIHQGKQSAVHFGPLPYLQWFIAYEGLILALLLTAGIIVALRRRSFPWLAVLVPIALPYLLYIWAPVIVPRNLSAAIPFASILAAAALVTGARRLPGARAPLAASLAVALILAGDGARRTWALSEDRSGYSYAAAYIRAHSSSDVLTVNEITAFYFRGTEGRCRYSKVPRTLSQLNADIRGGYSYALMDHFSRLATRY